VNRLHKREGMTSPTMVVGGNSCRKIMFSGFIGFVGHIGWPDFS
jgi:hypothetical protein